MTHRETHLYPARLNIDQQRYHLEGQNTFQFLGNSNFSSQSMNLSPNLLERQNDSYRRQETLSSSEISRSRRDVPKGQDLRYTSPRPTSNPRQEAVAVKRRNEDTLHDQAKKQRIENNKSTNNKNRVTDTRAKVPAEGDKSVKQHLIDDKKVAIIANDKKIHKRILSDASVQMKLLLLEFKNQMNKDKDVKIFVIPDEPDDRKQTSDAVFCFETANSRCLYQAKYYSREYGKYKKIHYGLLRSHEFNLSKLYRAFRKIGSCDRIIVCCNLELDDSALRENNIEVLIEDANNDTRTIRVFEESSFFKKMVKNHSSIHKLAVDIYKHMRSGNPVKLSGLMEQFHVMLVKENVFNIIQTDDKQFVAKFHEKFINSDDCNLKPAIVYLRRYLKKFNLGKLPIHRELKVNQHFGKDKNSEISQTYSKATDEDFIKKFFKKLIFTICEENVDYKIRQTIGNTFEFIQSEFHVEALSNEIFERMQRGRGKDQAELFPSLERKILSCDLMNYQQSKNEMQIKLEFELNSLQSLKQLLTNNKQSTVIIKTDNPRLCILRLQQVIEDVLKHPKGQFFFLDVDEMLGAKNHLLTVFSVAKEHLLVIQTDGFNLKNEEVKDCIRDIRQRISNVPNVTNKMVIVQNTNDLPLNLSFDVTEQQEIFNSKARLTKTSRDTLSETFCQNYNHDDTTYEFALKKLFLETDDLADLLNSAQSVNELIQRKLIIQKNLIKPCIFESTYNLPRRLKRHVCLNAAVLKKTSKDIFILSGIESESIAGKNVYYFEDSDFAYTKYVQFVRKNKKVNVHLFKCVSNRGVKQLIWQMSNRSISALMKFVIENKKALRESQPISDILARRITIISGEPGSGKSYYLFELARNLLINNRNFQDWVVQINFTKDMVVQHTDAPLNSPDEAVDVLTNILGFDELRKRLFHLSAAGKLKMKLSLFVDGLEELSESNVGKIAEILRLLRETKIKRICVATRPLCKKILERALDDFAFNLDALLKEEKSIFLLNTLLGLTGENFTEKVLRKFVDTILKTFNWIFPEPLYLHLLAVVCWPYLKNGQDVPRMHRICDVYEEYFDKFLSNLEVSKRNRYCLKRVVPLEVLRHFNLHEEEPFSEEFHKLNHLSFAEYGVAKWLASLRLNEQITAFNRIQDISRRLSIVFFETFISNCAVQYDQYIMQIGSNRLVIELFRFIWRRAEDHQKLHYLRTALVHSEDLFKSFLDKFNDTGSRLILEHGEFRQPEYAFSSLVELINKEKLVLETAKKKNVNLTCELILRGANIEEVPEEFVKRTAVHVAFTLVQLEPNQPHPYWSIIEKLMKLTPGASASLDEAVQLPRLLSYFFAHGRLEVITKILNRLGDVKRQKLLNTRVDSRTPLEIVNSSATMTDEQRLEISRFLLSEHDVSEVFSVMTAAAKCGHDSSFQYFAGTSRERLSRFFKSALRSNQLDVLRFLLKNSRWTVDYDCADNQPLHTAVIEKASIKTLKFLASYGGLDNRNKDGETVLSLAIQAGVDLRIVKFFVDQGADVNARDNRELAPWCYAVLAEFCRYSPEQQLDLMCSLKNKARCSALRQSDNYELTCWNEEIKFKIKYLSDPKGFDLNYEGTKPRLHATLCGQDTVLFMFLLQHGADPNALDSEGRSALHVAVVMGNSEKLLMSVRELLRHGAIFDVVNRNNRTPLHLLQARKNLTKYEIDAYNLLRQAGVLFYCIALLKKESSVRDPKAARSTALYWLLYCRDSKKRTLLHRAAEQNLPCEDLKNLLEFSELYGRRGYQRTWLDARDVNGDTAAHVAASLGKFEILKELWRKGACLGLKNAKGEIPRDLTLHPGTNSWLHMTHNLFARVRENSLETSLLLCTKYYCTNVRDERGRTLLHAAASGQNLSLCQFLLKWKARADATDDEGRTPLHSAVEADNFGATKLLIKMGASVDARDDSGKRPADLGSQDDNRSAGLVHALTEMLERAWRGELTVDALEAKIDSLAEKFELEPIVVVNAIDNNRNSLVHHAVRNYDLKLVKALLKHGAVYNACNSANMSPLDLANGEIKELLNGIDDMFKNPSIALWEAKKEVVGLEIMTRCRKSGGYTLMHASLETGKVEEAQWLLSKGAEVNVTNNLGASARKLAEGFQLVEENLY